MLFRDGDYSSIYELYIIGHLQPIIYIKWLEGAQQTCVRVELPYICNKCDTRVCAVTESLNTPNDFAGIYGCTAFSGSGGCKCGGGRVTGGWIDDTGLGAALSQEAEIRQTWLKSFTYHRTMKQNDRMERKHVKDKKVRNFLVVHCSIR